MLARVNTKPRKQNSHRADEYRRVPGFLQWLRGRNCALLEKGGCGGKVRACHVDYAGGKGMGLKVGDWFSLPMCDDHHGAQHTWGWKTFEANFRLDALAISRAYWNAWLSTTMGRNWEAKQNG